MGRLAAKTNARLAAFACAACFLGWLGGTSIASAGPRPKYYVAVVQAPTGAGAAIKADAKPSAKATAPEGAKPAAIASASFGADARVAIARREMAAALQTQPLITSNAKEAKRLRLPLWSLDVGVTRFEQHYREGQIELEAELQVSLSDVRGRIVSVHSKTVTLPVRRSDYHPKLMPQFIADLALGATTGIADELVTHLGRQVARR